MRALLLASLVGIAVASVPAAAVLIAQDGVEHPSLRVVGVILVGGGAGLLYERLSRRISPRPCCAHSR